MEIDIGFFHGSFVRVFSDKAKLSKELARIPIYLVLNEDAPVLGAAYEGLASLVTS